MKGPNADNVGSGYAVIIDLFIFIMSLLPSLESSWLR